jgi:hypothetical protein
MFTRNVFLSSLVALALASTGALAGCSADTSNGDEDVVEGTEEELTKAGKALIGSYKDDSGAFQGLILTSVKAGQANEFVADVDTGIRCITTPCPSSERITGTFTAGPKTITFKSTSASQNVQHLLGKYNYLVQGNKFSIWRKGFAQSLEKVPSYCAQSSDCYSQDIIHPMCMGQFDCEQNSCSWSCVPWPPPPPPPLDPCKGSDEATCLSKSFCQPIYGPSACSPDGRICTADMAYKGCEQKPSPPPPSGAVCLSSSSCAAGEHCTTEDGVCNPYGMLAVCAGTCETAK